MIAWPFRRPAAPQNESPLSPTMVCTGSARSPAEAPADTIRREYHGSSQIIAIASMIDPKVATTHSCPSFVLADSARTFTPGMVHLLMS